MTLKQRIKRLHQTWQNKQNQDWLPLHYHVCSSHQRHSLTWFSWDRITWSKDKGRESLKLYFVVKAKMKTQGQKYTQQHLLLLEKKSISSKSIMRFETTADSCHFTNHCCSIAFKFAIARSMQIRGWAAPSRTKHRDRSLLGEKRNISWFHKDWLVKVHSSFIRLPVARSVSANLTNKQKTRNWNFILGWVEGGGRKRNEFIKRKRERWAITKRVEMGSFVFPACRAVRQAKRNGIISFSTPVGSRWPVCNIASSSHTSSAAAEVP